ncbi:hypothetical protein Psfp_03799 [Pelotomaculum sp. FP]|nr:hypothetical protein Psfp_03799 [Pelotomaculum sp. FP]
MVYHNWKVYRWAYNQLHSQRVVVSSEKFTTVTAKKLTTLRQLLFVL